MKASFFSSVFYMGHAANGWPTAKTHYTDDDAKHSMAVALEHYRIAEETGFDWLSLAEHHFGPVGLTPNPMVFAGLLTQVAKRAKIALLGATIPILNPVRVAEEFAMLDVLTEGRVVAGMLRGTPNEYVTYNVNPAESRGRFEEALELIRYAWTQTEPFAWQGRYFQYRAISIWPRPIQNPHPPIYMSGSSPESGVFAAEARVSLGLAVTTVPRATKAAELYRETARKNGWEPSADNILYRMSFHVAETDEQAIADYEDSKNYPQRLSPIALNQGLERTVASTGYYGAELDKNSARNIRAAGLQDRVDAGQVVIGSPETVVKQLKAIKDTLNPGVLDLNSAFQIGERTSASIRLFGEKVLPHIHAF